MLKLGGIYKQLNFDTYFVIIKIDNFFTHTYDIFNFTTFDKEMVISNQLLNKELKRQIKENVFIKERERFWNSIHTTVLNISDGYLGQIDENDLKILQRNM